MKTAEEILKERNKYRRALEEICELHINKTTDGGGARDLNYRYVFAAIAQAALLESEESEDEQEG